MISNGAEQPTTAARVTETTLSDLQKDKAHAAFKRSNAQDAVIKTQAMLLANQAELQNWTDEYARLENSLTVAVARFHDQSREVLGKPVAAAAGIATQGAIVTAASGLTEAERATVTRQMDLVDPAAKPAPQPAADQREGETATVDLEDDGADKPALESNVQPANAGGIFAKLKPDAFADDRGGHSRDFD